MKRFREIDYSKMLYETLRNWFSINSSGQLTVLYRYCLSIIYPMQKPFDDFAIWRESQRIIALCKWQVGQLTNVLNYLYPSTNPNGITINEVIYETIYVPGITAGEVGMAPPNDYTYFVPRIEDCLIGYADSDVLVERIDNPYLAQGLVTFEIPTDIWANKTDIEDTIDKINIGVNYNTVEV